MLARPLHTCLFLLLSAACLPGCRPELAKGSPGDPFEPERAWAEALRQQLDEALREQAEARAGAGFIDAKLAKEEKKPWNTRVKTSIKYADLLRELYGARKGAKIAADQQGLTARGAMILQELKTFPRHMIEEPMDYHIQAIEALDARMKAAAKDITPWRAIALEAKEVEAVVAWARAHQVPLEPREQARATLLRALSAQAGDKKEDARAALPSPAPRITAQLKAFEASYARRAEEAAQLELLIIDGALRFARDMKTFNLSRLSWSELKDAGGSKALIYKRQAEVFADLGAAKTPEAMLKVMRGLHPPGTQYTRLVEARARYKAIVEQGGWGRTGRVTLRAGVRGEQVARLRERLRLEGYLPTDQTLTTTLPVAPGKTAPQAQSRDELMDEALLKAVETYHRTHQLRFEPGRPSKVFWKSLNVSAQKRLAQLELNLERRRESRYEGEPDYVFVNLPDFHAEVFGDHERKMRFRVVIGKNNRKCDPQTNTWTYPNATPQLMSELDYFILNPSWYVPSRIIEEEIKPNVEKDETWLERNHYEIVKKSGKEQEDWVVRQTPGPHNALGLVKFIFPNKHNTYMHDTAKKKYFDYHVRAFSHGCVRVNEPLELARYLVEADGQAQQIKVDEILAEERSKMVKLTKKLPVFLEYYTATVDDEGHANFLIDIYNLDARAFSPSTQAFDACSAPAPVSDGEDEMPDDVQGDLGP